MWLLVALGCAAHPDPAHPDVAWERIRRIQPMIPALATRSVRGVEWGWLGPCVTTDRECDQAELSHVGPAPGVEAVRLRYDEDGLTGIEVIPAGSCRDSMCFTAIVYELQLGRERPYSRSRSVLDVLPDGWRLIQHDD